MKLNFNKLTDLTHTLTSSIPSWDEPSNYDLKTIMDYQDCPAHATFKVQCLCSPLGFGTHIDFPSHMASKGTTAELFDIQMPFYDTVVINLSQNVHKNLKINLKHIIEHEKKYKPLGQNSLILFYTGWEQFWYDPIKYRNQLIFPSIAKETADYLLDKNIAGIGIDTLSPDNIESCFEVHKILLNNEKFILENVARANQLPAIGAKTLVAPLKIQAATESPLRLLALHE